MSKLLFLFRDIAKSEGNDTTKKKPYGLINSSYFIYNLLYNKGASIGIEYCLDQNEIDSKLHKHNPKICVLEAVWFTPEKLLELLNLYPEVTFIIRLHSHYSFLAIEYGIIDKLYKFISVSKQKNNRIIISGNSKDFTDSLSVIINEPILYLPNYYWLDREATYKANNLKQKKILKVGCFGAMRIMKNHLMQGVASILTMKKLNKYLEFHTNTNFELDDYNATHNNIDKLFSNRTDSKIIKHDWKPHNQFKEIVKQMDLNLQVSMSETFNITAADSIVSGIPVIVSDYVGWISNKETITNTQNPFDLSDKMMKLLENDRLREDIWITQYNDLRRSNMDSEREWLNFVKLNNLLHG